jgi:ribosomal-protein-alanine N-acetyltransferase
MMAVSAMPLRDYRRSDFESIWALDRECFPPGIAYSRSELRAFLAEKTAETIVAEREGCVVAFVLGVRRRGTGHVITLDVAASARRRGLGRQLLTALERRFRAAGVTRVQLETAVTNRTAIAFYERLGYRTVAHLDSYYGPGLHASRMAKTLHGPARPQARPRSGASEGAPGAPAPR